jgi:hypothetical protein
MRRTAEKQLFLTWQTSRIWLISAKRGFANSTSRNREYFGNCGLDSASYEADFLFHSGHLKGHSVICTESHETTRRIQGPN